MGNAPRVFRGVFRKIKDPAHDAQYFTWRGKIHNKAIYKQLNKILEMNTDSKRNLIWLVKQKRLSQLK